MARPSLSLVAPRPMVPRRWRSTQVLAAAGFIGAVLAASALGAAALEARIVGSVLNLRGWSGVSAQGPVFVVWSGQGPPITLKITWSCSAAVQVAAVGGALLMFGTSRGRARAAGMAVGAAVVVLGNLVRLTATVWLAGAHGPGASLLFHDWAGTAITLAMGATGIVLGVVTAHHIAERLRRPPVAPSAVTW